MLRLPEIQQLFNDYLSKQSFTQQPAELYEPINYILQLGGKRLRPALVLMATGVFDEEVAKGLPLAYAIEIFHNFTLVHDDIMDQAPLRRGKPTVHHRYDVNTGILSGDVMLIYAYDYILKTENQALHSQLIQSFNKVAIEVCEGQQMDMNFERRNDVTIAEYLKMIEYKTAALIGGALELGARVGGANDTDAINLGHFGRNAGIAFQLQDDYLDAFGEPEKVGKQPGGDILQNKKTYLILKALEVADASDRDTLQQLLSTTPKEGDVKVERVISIMQSLKIADQVEEAKQYYLQQAKVRLEQVGGSDEAKAMLLELADKLANREF